MVYHLVFARVSGSNDPFIFNAVADTVFAEFEATHEILHTMGVVEY